MPLSSGSPTTDPTLYAAVGRVTYEITQTNQGINGIAITGSFALNNTKYLASEGIIASLDLPVGSVPNFPDIEAILPLYS